MYKRAMDGRDHSFIVHSLDHPMPVGVGETRKNSELHIPQSPIAAPDFAPVSPVSSSMMPFKVKYGRPTVLVASGVQRRRFPAGSSW